METIELEHWKSYLGTGLKCQIQVDGMDCVETLTGIEMTRDGFVLIFGCITIRGKKEAYPYLHPLSRLTKPIEHNGEKFVPLIELAKIAFPKSGVYTIKNEYIELGLAYSFHINIKEISFDCRRSFNGKKWDYTCYVPNQLQLFQKLFEWKFDVFNLIPAGLAIKQINNIE